MANNNQRLKKVSWCIIGLLLMGGLFVLVDKSDRDPLQVIVIGKTNTSSGWPAVTVRVSNRSSDVIGMSAVSEIPNGAGWSLIIPAELRGNSKTVGRGETWDVNLPTPRGNIRWRIRIDAEPATSRLDLFR